MVNAICQIRKVVRAITQFEHSIQSEYGLNLNEAMLLCVLSEKDKASSGEIAHELGLSTSNASKVIGSIENKLLIQRIGSLIDKREMRFTLTEQGREKHRELCTSSILIPDVRMNLS